MTKSFKIYKDQAKTIKDRLVRAGSKPEIKTVLEDINLDIHKGETVALIGTNGSGKSTLLKLMTKILYPNKGTVSTQGKLTSLLELGAGFHMDFTGRENIYFNASVFGLTRKEIDKRIDRIIEFSELGPNIDEPVRTYSSGMYMRLAFQLQLMLMRIYCWLMKFWLSGISTFRISALKNWKSFVIQIKQLLLFLILWILFKIFVPERSGSIMVAYS